MLYLSIRDNDEADYVFHPINAFHLMKRLALSMPNLLKKIPNLEFNYELLKKISADYLRSFHGLADIHEYFAFETTEIAAGHLKDLKTGKIFKSNSPLSSEELLQIAEEAKEVSDISFTPIQELSCELSE